MKLFLRYFLIFISTICYGMEQFTLDVFKDDQISSIIKSMIATVGTPSIKNEKDIPVIVRYVKSLSLVNKRLYAAVNSSDVTSDIITGLARRFGISELDAAAALQTPGAWQWVETNVVPSEYALFSTVQKIHDMVEETAREFKEKHDCWIKNGRSGWPESNPFYGQTKEGILLSLGSYPDELCTPWGKTMLTGGGAGTTGTFRAFTQAVFTRLSTTLAYVPEKDIFCRGELRLYEQKKIDLNNNDALKWDDIYREISPEDAKQKIGTNSIIVAGTCGYNSYYKVHAIDDKKLPQPELLAYKEYRSYETVKYLWKILETRYKKEHGIVDKKPDVPQCERREVSAPKEDEYPLVRLSDLPEWTVGLMQNILAQQPKKSSDNIQSYFLPLLSYDDARILNLISGILRGKKFYLYESGFLGGGSKKGIKLTCYEKDVPSCLTDAQIYQDIFEKLTNGWRISSLVDYPNILHKRSEEEWCLLIKEKQLKGDEVVLMRFLADKLKVRNKIAIDQAWEHPDKGYEYTNCLYLWIKKDAYDEVVSKFELKLEEQENCQTRSRCILQ